jgi:hypothetical protein
MANILNENNKKSNFHDNFNNNSTSTSPHGTLSSTSSSISNASSNSSSLKLNNFNEEIKILLPNGIETVKKIDRRYFK